MMRTAVFSTAPILAGFVGFFGAISAAQWQRYRPIRLVGAAKARGVKLGSPVARETVAIATAHRRGDTSANRVSALKAIQKIQAADIVSARGIARELTARKVPTPTGSSTWAPAQVQRLLRTDRPSGRRS